MTKTSRQKLIEQISDGIFAYFREGEVNSKILAKKIIDPNLEKIRDFEQLIRIHFLIQDRVVNFIKDLNQNIRNLRKKIQNILDLRRNKIKGQVRWHRTYLIRNSRFYNDKSVFICNNPLMNFNTDENLILKSVLLNVYNIFKNDLKDYEHDNFKYRWFDKWKEDKDLIHEFFKLYEKNIYINKIDNSMIKNITNKTILNVLNSRNTLYTKAAELLNEYIKILKKDYDKKLLTDLLKSTLIIPHENSTLFELFCLFKVVFKIQEFIDIRLNIISKENREFAIFENDTNLIKIFHDATGSLNFYEPLVELDPKDYKSVNYLRRLVQSRKEYYRIINNLLKTKPKDYLYSGRPDLVIEIWKKESENLNVLEKIYIGEIKYTDNKRTFSKGMKELIEYLFFAKYKARYLIERREPSIYISDDLKIYGIFISDKTDFLKNNIDHIEDIEIQIYNSKSLESLTFNL